MEVDVFTYSFGLATLAVELMRVKQKNAKWKRCIIVIAHDRVWITTVHPCRCSRVTGGVLRVAAFFGRVDRRRQLDCELVLSIVSMYQIPTKSILALAGV